MGITELTAGTSEFVLFTLILMRMSGFVFLNPILGRRGIPAMSKTGMTFVLAILIFSLNPSFAESVITTPLTYGLILLREFFIGWVCGFSMYLFDFGITYAGAIIDFQMGLSMANVYDPASNTQTALTGRMLQIYYMLMFFAMDGHLAMMKIFVSSYELLPYGGLINMADASEAVFELFIRCVELAVKLSFPFIAIEFIGEIAVGILMKMIPQINLFIISIQMKIVIGIFLFVIAVSPVGDFIEKYIQEVLFTVEGMLKIMSTG